MPIAVPTMPDSASGESITRWSPKSFCSPSVTRKTPPSLPTSSPAITTLASASSARRKPAFRALAMVSTVIRQSHRTRAQLVGGPRQVRGVIGRLGVDSAEEVVLAGAGAAEVGPYPLDRILEPPVLQFVSQPVLRRVVRCRVRAHPVRVRLDEARAVSASRALQSGGRHGVHRENVISVDPYAGEAEPGSTPVQRDAGLAFDRFRNRPLVVLAEEDDGSGVGAGEDKGLVDITLAGGAVTEIADDGDVAVRITGAHQPVTLDTHGIAGGMQRLGTDDDRVDVEVGRCGIPGAEIDASVEREQMDRVDSAAPGNAVLAVSGEDEILLLQRAAGPDLRSFLAEAGRPEPQLSLSLQGRRLGIDSTSQHHVSVPVPDLVIVTVEGVLRVSHSLALRRQQLNQFDLGADTAGIAHCGAFLSSVCAGRRLLLNVPRGSAAPENNLWALESSAQSGGTH